MKFTIVEATADVNLELIRRLQIMYEPSTIPFCILNETFHVLWYNRAMERVCPDIIAPGRILSDTTIPLKWISDYLEQDKDFCDCFHAESVFAPLGFVLGKIPMEEKYYYMQARDTVGGGTWRNPSGLERAVCAFESVMRKQLNTIFQGLKEERKPDLKKIKHGADNLYRAMLMTNDYARLLGGLYGGDPVCVELQSFLSDILDCAGEMIQNAGTEFDHRCFRNAYSTATHPVLLATILCHLLSNAVRYGGKNNRVYVDAAINHSELQIAISNQGNEIPMKLLPHIYEPYQSYPKSGADIFSGYGLGLTIAQAGAVFLGGSLSGFSHRKRTVFRLLLPLKECGVGPGPNNELPGYPDTRSFVRILLADCLM